MEATDFLKFISSKEKMSLTDFAKLHSKNRQNIISATYHPPRIGIDRHFGIMEVEYRAISIKKPNEQNAVTTTGK